VRAGALAWRSPPPKTKFSRGFPGWEEAVSGLRVVGIAVDPLGESRRRCRPPVRVADFEDAGASLAFDLGVATQTRSPAVGLNAIAGDFFVPSSPFLPGDLRRVPGGGVPARKHRLGGELRPQDRSLCSSRVLSYLVPCSASSRPAVEGRPPASRRCRKPINVAEAGKLPSTYTTPPFWPFEATGVFRFLKNYSLGDAAPGTSLEPESTARVKLVRTPFLPGPRRLLNANRGRRKSRTR
jgi:hypothetical protein